MSESGRRIEDTFSRRHIHEFTQQLNQTNSAQCLVCSERGKHVTTILGVDDGHCNAQTTSRLKYIHNLNKLVGVKRGRVVLALTQ